MADLMQKLRRRRESLGITYADLAARSGVSVATVKRVFSDGIGNASLCHVAAIADAMGMGVDFSEGVSALDFKEEAAEKKARSIVERVQATSSLEAQAIDEPGIQECIRESFHRLMAGPARRIWSS